MGVEPLVAPKDQAGPGFADCEKNAFGVDLGIGAPQTSLPL